MALFKWTNRSAVPVLAALAVLKATAAQADEPLVTVLDLQSFPDTTLRLVPDGYLQTGETPLQARGAPASTLRGRASIALTADQNVLLEVTGAGTSQSDGMRGGVSVRFRF